MHLKSTLTRMIISFVALGGVLISVSPAFAATKPVARAVHVPAAPAGSFPECHANSRPVGSSVTKGFNYTDYGVVTSGTLVVQLEYCDNDRSNFARVFFHPDAGSTGSAPGMTEYVDRLSGPDGPADYRQATHDIAPGGYQDSPVLFSPNNKDQACVYLVDGDGNCTGYY